MGTIGVRGSESYEGKKSAFWINDIRKNRGDNPIQDSPVKERDSSF
jgi:hypothetical protein